MSRLFTRCMSIISVGAVCLLAISASAFALVPAAAAAGVLYVAPSGSGGGSCSAPDYNTIQDAINGSSAGDTIMVCAGTYAQNIDITQSVTLQGAQADISTNWREPGGPNESVIAGTGGTAVVVSADNVTIDGFTISNASGSVGVYASEHSNVAIRYNFIMNMEATGTTKNTDSAIGIYVKSYSSSINSIVIENNAIEGIHQIGSTNSADGIFVGDSSGEGTTISGLVIRDNAISDVTANTTSWPAGHGAYGILINHGTSAAAGSTDGAQIIGNTITDLDGLWAHGIGLEGNTPNATVEYNDISHLTDHKSPSDAAAVNVEDNPSADTIALHFNDFSYVSLGVQNNTASNPTVNATRNWWGCFAGPNHGHCAGTNGAVTVRPWLIFPVMPSDALVPGNARGPVFGGFGLPFFGPFGP